MTTRRTLPSWMSAFSFSSAASLSALNVSQCVFASMRIPQDEHRSWRVKNGRAAPVRALVEEPLGPIADCWFLESVGVFSPAGPDRQTHRSRSHRDARGILDLAQGRRLAVR